MQYIIVAILVLAAVALVIVPLVRTPRDAGAGDIDAPEPQRRREDVAEPPVAPAPPEPRHTPEPALQPPGEAGAEELPQAAPPPAAPARPLGAASSDPGTEEEILRYREALRARTICPACSTANPPGSKFCKECGEALTAAGGSEAGSRARQ